MSEMSYAVVYEGESGMLCQEAVGRSENGARLQNGQRIEELSEFEAKRFLTSHAFTPADDATEKLYEAMKGDRARRINGSVIAAMAEAEEDAPRNLSAMKKDELLAVAEEIGIESSLDDTKANLVEKIEASEQPDEDFDPVTDTGEETPVNHGEEGGA